MDLGGFVFYFERIFLAVVDKDFAKPTSRFLFSHQVEWAELI